MPKGVVRSPKEEKIWDYKKKQVEKQTGKKESQFTDIEWRRVNYLYQKAKKKYKGRLPQKYTAANFKERVHAAYEVKPLEHFKESGTQQFWSIQTERTHGRKGIIRVSESQLEDPNLAVERRMAGAEDIFQGTKKDLLNYINQTYKGVTAVEFV